MRLLRYLPRFQRAYQAQAVMADREGWSREEIEGLQLQRINQVWKHAREHVPYYRRLSEQEDIPRRFSDLSEYRSRIPPLAKETVRSRPDEFLSEVVARGSWHRTGGSTGTPTRVYWPTEAHRESLRSRYRCQMQWGVDILDRQAMLWGHSASFAPGWQGWWARRSRWWEDRLRGRLRLSAYQLGPSDLESYLHQLRTFRPALLYGYSSAVHLLACQARQTGLACPSLRVCLLSGEPAFDWLKEEIEQALQAPAAVEYGSVECGIIASEGPDRVLRVREDTTLLETVPRDDGYYDILVTVLINSSFPLLRFQVGDVTNAPTELPARGFAILKQVTGRQNDMLRSRAGRLVHSLSVKHALEHCPNVRRFTAHQDTSGSLKVFVESTGGKSSTELQGAAAKLEEMLDGYPVVIEAVEVIPHTVAGKHRWVVSELVGTP